jgi:hypothetical protein
MPRDRHYPADLTDAQWALIEPLFATVSRGGQPEKHPRPAFPVTVAGSRFAPGGVGRRWPGCSVITGSMPSASNEPRRRAA